MFRRVGLAMLALVLVGSILVPAQLSAQPNRAATETHEDLKGARTEEDDSAVPASSEWSMLIMVVLVLSASTAMLAGGGFFNRRVRFEFVMPGADAEPEAGPDPDPTPAPKKATRAQASKHKGKRSFSRRERQDWRQKGSNFTGRRGIARRKSGGPGCRGVR